MLKSKPKWLNRLTGEGYWVTITPNVYYPSEVTEPQDYPSILAHESVHLTQQRNLAYFLFWWLPRYAFSAKFRLAQEIEAVVAELQALPFEARANAVRNNAWNLSNGYRFLGISAASSEEQVIALLRPKIDF